MAKKRMRDSLPKKIHELRMTGDKLLKEAKGLGGRAQPSRKATG